MTGWVAVHWTASCDTAISSPIIPPPPLPLATELGYVTPLGKGAEKGLSTGLYVVKRGSCGLGECQA